MSVRAQSSGESRLGERAAPQQTIDAGEAEARLHAASAPVERRRCSARQPSNKARRPARIGPRDRGTSAPRARRKQRRRNSCRCPGASAAAPSRCRSVVFGLVATQPERAAPQQALDAREVQSRARPRAGGPAAASRSASRSNARPGRVGLALASAPAARCGAPRAPSRRCGAISARWRSTARKKSAYQSSGEDVVEPGEPAERAPEPIEEAASAARDRAAGSARTRGAPRPRRSGSRTRSSPERLGGCHVPAAGTPRPTPAPAPGEVLGSRTPPCGSGSRSRRTSIATAEKAPAAAPVRPGDDCRELTAAARRDEPGPRGPRPPTRRRPPG